MIKWKSSCKTYGRKGKERQFNIVCNIIEHFVSKGFPGKKFHHYIGLKLVQKKEEISFDYYYFSFAMAQIDFAEIMTAAGAANATK